MPRLAGMFLRDLLPAKGIPGPSELGRRLGIARQHAFLLWHGYVLPSAEMLQKLRDRLQLPPEILMQLERAEPSERRGRKPPRRRRKPKKEGPGDE